MATGSSEDISIEFPQKSTRSNLILDVSTLTWSSIADVILQSRICVFSIAVIVTLNFWNQSMPSIEKGNFGMIHNGRFCFTFVFISCTFYWTCSRKRHETEHLSWRSFEHFDDGALCGASMLLDPVLNVHACCKTCIIWRLQFQCHWSTYFHRSLPLNCLSNHWERLISCQWVQRLVSESQLFPESLNWFLDFKT